jgi:glycosyltransferase involved in cell wall biosynthesis
MKILFIDHTAALGGGELAMLNLISGLDRTRYDVEVLLFSDGPLVQRLRQTGIAVRIERIATDVGGAKKDSLGLASLLRFKVVAHSLLQVLRVRQYIRRGNFDVVHTNSLKADIIGGLAGRLAGAAVVWHVRDRISEEYLPAKVARLFRFLCRVIPTYLIANSKATLATVNRGHDQAVVPSGVALQHVSPVAPRPDNGIPRIGIIGRLSPWKGQEIFIRAAAEVLRAYPSARFSIVGAALFDEKDFEASLHQLVDQLGLNEAVTFEGFRDDVRDVIRSLDIVVHASTVGEPFGQVVVEAMSESKPVVATNGGGVPEIVVDGVTGRLVPMGDAAAMAAAIVQLLGDPQTSSEMGRRGRLRVEEHFTIQKTVEKVSYIYDQVVSTRGPGHRPRTVMPS